MNLALWIVAGLLAAVFLFSGSFKLVTPREKLLRTPGAGWTNDFSAGFIKGLGVIEISAAFGLILPAALDILPILVPVTAAGMAALMVGAAVVVIRRKESKHALVNMAYLAMAMAVVWGRFGPESFS